MNTICETCGLEFSIDDVRCCEHCGADGLCSDCFIVGGHADWACEDH